MMMLKKLAIVGIASLGLSGLASTAQAVSVTANTVAQDVTYTADDKFVVNNFQFAVSSNVGLASTENTVAIAVGTASNKGRNAFTGSSNGGSVTTCGAATTGAAIPAVPSPTLTNVGGCASNATLGGS